MKKPLQIISEINESIKLEIERLEPPRIITSNTQVKALQADSFVIRRGLDYFRTFSWFDYIEKPSEYLRDVKVLLSLLDK